VNNELVRSRKDSLGLDKLSKHLLLLLLLLIMLIIIKVKSLCLEACSSVVGCDIVVQAGKLRIRVPMRWIFQFT
jgi:hypothetical protein